MILETLANPKKRQLTQFSVEAMEPQCVVVRLQTRE